MPNSAATTAAAATAAAATLPVAESGGVEEEAELRRVQEERLDTVRHKKHAGYTRQSRPYTHNRQHR